MDVRLFSMMNAVLDVGNTDLEMFKEVNKVALRCGYIIPERCCSSDVIRWLEQEVRYNPNSTFYKTLDDVVSKNRFEILMDQIVHYMSTYGTDFHIGNGYVPNKNVDEIDYSVYKIAGVMTKDEMVDKLLSMMYSGIALSTSTIDIIVNSLTEFKALGRVEPDKIKNKEALPVICSMLDVLPNDEFGMLRTIVYKAIGSSMLIKSKTEINALKTASGRIACLFNKLNDAQLKVLSRIFLRYKPIFLAMKCEENCTAINKIRRYAKKNHKPLKIGFWENCFKYAPHNLIIAKQKANELNNFKKVQLMDGIMRRRSMILKGFDSQAYVIRNGKVFVRENYPPKADVEYLEALFMIVKDSLVESLSKKENKKISLPKGITLACPTSEKNFVGNFPCGSVISFGKDNNIIGIYWRNEWGTRDFDLHYYDSYGRSFGWNASYYDMADVSNIVYSGDMTNADPEATEIFWIKDTITDGIVKVNKYYGESKSKLKIFVATGEEPADINPTIDPNKMVFSTILDFDDTNEKMIGVVQDRKLILCNQILSPNIVPKPSQQKQLLKNMSILNKSHCSLPEVLSEAGFEIDYDCEEDTFNKSTLIELFS